MSRADGALAIAIIECATVNCTIANFWQSELSCATNQSFEPSMKYADGVLSISKTGRATADCILIYFWQNEAKIINTFKGDRLTLL